MNNIIKALELCKWAPSGGNTQPWDIFVIDLTSQSITIGLLLSEECRKSDLLMEAHGAGALYSLGSLSHTIKKVFSYLGWKAQEDEFLANESAYKCQATLKFKNCHKKTHSLTDIESLLKNRRSNRCLYKRTSIDENTKNLLSLILDNYPNLKLTTYEKTKNKVAQIIGKLENIRCQNRQISQEFLREIHFGPTQIGLPANTLGQPIWAQFLMRSWKRISAIRYLFFLGSQWIFRYLAVDRPIKNSGALFAIQAKELDYKSIYQVGQCLCESWFMLGEQGYDVQVFGLPIFSLLEITHPKSQQILTDNERNIISQVRVNLKKLGIDISKPCLLFRSGVAIEQAKLTPRRAVNILHNPKQYISIVNKAKTATLFD